MPDAHDQPLDRREETPVDKPVLKRCPDRRCKAAVHTWTWLTDDGEPTGPTYICRPGAPS